MALHEIVGLVLALTGVVDVVVARMFLARTLENSQNRELIVNSVTLGGVLLFILGGAFLAGLIPL